ncbi:hypothetical protein QVD17_38814 [Tagetes erecta]|uniref:F-box domain-containing protein n=1 Tax=Tagetes erecta TaxID=13708 RepID=A0AAD8JST4_TARER|nr:hypothetical protein QVD17_38814 [Tagetes erecta]
MELRRHRNILPMDIIETEILTKLPARSVGRMMCVCRRWRSFLSTQAFQRNNITTQPIQKLLLIDSSMGTFSSLDCGTTPNDLSIISHRRTPFKASNEEEEDMHIVAACLDGLVCVAMSKSKQLILWNPLTGAYNMLSVSHLPLHTFNRIDLDAFGLYFDSCNNEYKVLHLVRDQKGPRVYIYSQRLDLWRRKVLCCNCDWFLDCWTYQWSSAIFLDQTLYFNVVRDDHSCIAAFDVTSERFREIHYPCHVSGVRAYYVSLMVINNCLHLCVPRHDVTTRFYMPLVDNDVWRMVGDGDGDGWIKVSRFNNSMPFTFTPNCRTRHGGWDVVWRFNKAYTKHSVKAHRWLPCHLLRVIYTETLVSPNP